MTHSITLEFKLLDITGEATVRDLWAKKDLGTFSERSEIIKNSVVLGVVSSHSPYSSSFTPPEPVPSHGAKVYKIKKA